MSPNYELMVTVTDYEELSKNINVLIKEVSTAGNAVSKEQKNAWARAYQMCTQNEIKLFSQYVLTENYDEALKCSRQLNHIAKKILEIAKKNENYYLYTMGIFNGSYNVLRNMISHQSEEKTFHYKMSVIVGLKYMKEILQYLYEHEYAQNKNICSYLNIAPNQLYKQMKKLIDAGCINRYPVGKNVFYSLTKQGKKYVKNVLGCKRNAEVYGEAVIVEGFNKFNGRCFIDEKNSIEGKYRSDFV